MTLKEAVLKSLEEIYAVVGVILILREKSSPTTNKG